MAQAVWTKIVDDASIQRSSQTLSVVGNEVYVYGGELRPREPVDSTIYRISLNGASGNSTISSTPETPNTPQPRVGSASTTINAKIYLFSGRGGPAMSPIEEKGSFWTFDPTSNTWSQVKPADSHSPYPAGRSYHALTNNGSDTIFLHAGCPETGRLRDLWAFNTVTREWRELSAAPGPARGGASIAYADGKVFRMNGFDGKTEQGGSVDVFDVKSNEWTTVTYAADGISGPSPRSVASLLSVRIAEKACLVTLFGEHDPSSLGHQGAGKMLSDVWVFDIESGLWREVIVDGEAPPARGWFDADVVVDNSGSRIVVHGGLAESNERLGDIWSLDFSV
ncbi:hypothetical protein BDW59DRAFT_70047 [Aspergillus cavernicola]|uniref:Kelch repeat protein n=1 Tax=Aspergillus cavernicola TaxID=176166 RepID=A0ABR4IDE3_9EURO